MKKVLITDDEQSFLLSLKDGFKVHENKFIILTATNGQEAIEILKSTSVDLLVTDLEMPVMNGFEFLAWASRELPNLPLIVMTAFGTPEIESRLEQFDALRYLEKPLDLDTLEKAILEGLETQTKSYIQGITPATFLQLLHLENKSCTLKISSENRTGYLYLSEGNLIDAKFDDISGEPAANQIICWENSKIELDNFIQRHEGPIKSSMEALLLNAHRLKDERMAANDDQQTEIDTDELFNLNLDEPETDAAQDNTKMRPIQQQRVRDLLAKRLDSYNDIAEFALFDQQSLLECHNTGQCTLEVFDPAIYLHLTGLLEEKIGSGSINWMSFITSRRIPFILYNLVEYTLLVKLQQGVRPQPVGIEIRKIINATLAAG